MNMDTNSTAMPMNHSMGMGPSGMPHTGHMGHTMGMDHTMDHTMDHGDHGSDGGMNHMMQMTFYLSTSVTILFDEWKVSSVGGLIGSCVAVFFLAVLYEGLKVMRETLLRRSVVNVRYKTMQVAKGSETVLTETHGAGETRWLSGAHFLQTLLHVVQVTISYFLMLIFMTYNGWLCIAVALGAGTGYFLFGWKKAIVVDINEHCH
ncbi:high affinity copper uptake protein 1-like [Anneissia japonica]|uniref:high affinity copper uptake protein 1-like n=1 Tax=Anneissia japonica TaxID=1529436 RepID=UPI00142556AC|nr:high affinity copper uptake protein 1-like [Anneissia japonica]